MSGKKTKDTKSPHAARKAEQEAVKSTTRALFTGMTPEVKATFDYRQGTMNIVEFTKARSNLRDYLAIKFPFHDHMIDHLEYYVFPEIEDPEEVLDDVNDPHGIGRRRLQRRVDEQTKKEVIFEDNKRSVFALIWGQCSDQMRAKLRSDGVNEVTDCGDPLTLWHRIVDASTRRDNVNQDRRNPALHELETRALLTNLQFMRVDEHISDFHRRFENTYRVMVSNGVRLTGTVALFEQLDEESRENHQFGEDCQLAQLFLKKLNKERYGGMLTELQNFLEGYGDDRYPRSLQAAFDMASARAHTEPRVGKTIGGGRLTVDHSVAFVAEKDETTETDSEKPPQRKEKKGKNCFFCEKEGHFKNDCPLLKKAAKELAKKKKGKHDDGTAYMHQVMETVATTGTTKLKTGDVLLDNQSSVHLFKDKNLLTNIRKAPASMRVYGVGGSLDANLIGDLEGIGQVYYHPKAVANILSFNQVAKDHKIKYLGKKDAFTVKIDEEKTWEFNPVNRLYVCNIKFETDFIVAVANADYGIETIKGNSVGYTKAEKQRANNARELWKTLAYPSIKDFLWMIRRGKVIGTSVTPHDVDRMLKIYGPDCAVIKGRTTRKQPEPVIIEYVSRQISPHITLAADLMFIDGLPFLVTVSRRLQLVMTKMLSGKTEKDLRDAFNSIVSSYAAQKFRVNFVLTDGESAVKAIEEHLNRQGIRLNPAPPGAHVPEVERAIRLIKERMRIIWNSLPYMLPNKLIGHLVEYCVSMINICPKTTSVNPDLSPREVFTGRKLNAAKDCALPFGAYVQVHLDAPVTNTMAARTVGAIALRPTGNEQGSYMFMTLKGWTVITRGKWTKLPMPDEAIELINAKAEQDRSAALVKKFPTFTVGDIEVDDEDEDDQDDQDDRGEQQLGQEQDEVIVAPPLYGEPDNEVEPPQDYNQVINNDSNDDIIVDHRGEGPMVDDNDNQQQALDEPQPMEEPQQQPDHGDGDASTASSEEEELLPPTRYNTRSRTRAVTLNKEPALQKTQSIATNEEGNRMTLRPHRSDWRTREFTSYAFTTLSLGKSIKKFGREESIMSMLAEISQLETKDVFEPVNYQDLTNGERVHVLRTLMFLKRKRNGIVKSRLVADGSKQSREECGMDVSSPTASIESIFLIAAIAARDEKTTVTADVEGAYLHCEMFGKVHVELDPATTAMMLQLRPDYRGYVYKGKMYMKLKKALYGCIESAKLFHNHISGTLKAEGFVENPYDPCVFNKEYYGEVCTVTIHVDDLLITCKDPRGVEAVIDVLQNAYGKINVSRDTTVDYLGMEFDFTKKGMVAVSLEKMVETVADEWDPEDQSTAKTPAANNLFNPCTPSTARLLTTDEKEKFHSIVAKLLYMAKRARPDILLPVNYLTSRVKGPTVADHNKLDRVIKYLRGTKNMRLHLSAKDGICVDAYVDASYAVHPDAKSHTGVVMGLGQGSTYCKSSKQKLVAKSSTEAELIGVSDGLTQILWTRNFLQGQGYDVGPVTLHQDNKSTIVLAEKGRSNAGRTRHVNIRYFFIKDAIERKEVRVVYTPTEKMVADFFTKPLQGTLFQTMRARIMGHWHSSDDIEG